MKDPQNQSSGGAPAGGASGQTSLSVVMPALNEERNLDAAISDTLGAMDRFGVSGEIVVVNDGSDDCTSEIATTWASRDPRVRVLVHDRPRGIGASFWDGVDAAAMDSVVMLPGDNENDPDEILRYLPLLRHVDIVIPFLYDRTTRSLFRNALSFLYRFIVNTTFLVNINYTNGTVLYRRDVLRTLSSRSSGFFFQTDILIRLLRRGYLFAEVPYRVNVREHGRSKAVSFPSLYRVARGYIHLVRDIYSSRDREEGAYPSQSLTWHRRKNDSNPTERKRGCP